jgi:uncharacterized 2Fe-2S/4Fe-4S cluster protein (DUF4445 family)
MSGKCRISLHPHGRSIHVDQGVNLLSALYEHGIFLRTDCGGRGVCGKCRVLIGDQKGTFQEQNSCSIDVDRDLRIEIPLASLLSPEVIGKAPVRLDEAFCQAVRQQRPGRAGYGLAVDLGTTTVAMYLVAMEGPEILASLSLKNPQALYGDDVMSRICAVGEDAANLTHLQSLVVKTIELGIQSLLEAKGVLASSLKEMVVVGNPTMIHLFHGINPRPLGFAPYQPVFKEARSVASEALGFTQAGLIVRTLPQISGFIGGDLVSAGLAADIEHQPAGTLLIDIGTNGELILKAAGGLYATSCATGPAFEGATLSCGMQAVSGAIDDVDIVDPAEPPRCSILKQGHNGALTAVGVCGSGFISGMAAMLRAGVVEANGSFSRSEQIHGLTGEVPQRHYILYAPERSKNGQVVSINQKDIRSIQLGKAALITGIEFLMQAAGVERLDRIILAGAFGSHLKPEDLMTLGMIPRLARTQVEIGGNLAGTGAVMYLCDHRLRQRALQLAEAITVLELATDPAFQEVFIDRLQFPESEPSVA